MSNKRTTRKGYAIYHITHDLGAKNKLFPNKTNQKGSYICSANKV